MEEDNQQVKSKVAQLCDCLTRGCPKLFGMEPTNQELENFVNVTSDSSRSTARTSISDKKASQKKSLNVIMRYLGITNESKNDLKVGKNIKPSEWLDEKEKKEIELRKQAMTGPNSKIDTKRDYVFKSLLRQDYFNKRFESKKPPKSEFRREIQNFILFSEKL